MVPVTDDPIPTNQPDLGSQVSRPVQEKTVMDQLMPPPPTVTAERQKNNIPTLLILSMITLGAAAYFMNSRSMDIRSKAATFPKPTPTGMPVYITNSGSGKSCQDLCMSRIGRNCASVGIDQTVSDGQYYSAPATANVCSIRSGSTCLTVMSRNGSCKTSAVVTATFVTYDSTRCKCQ